MESYILVIDQGTTSTRAILFDRYGKMVAKAQREIENIFPQAAWVEQDALEIYVSALDVIHELVVKTNVKAEQIVSIGITNQRETAIVWDKNTGLPIYNAIVWQSKQTQEICAKVKKHEKTIREKTGLIVNPYFSASKFRFILDHVENAQARAEKGELLCGTVDAWLLYKLTGGREFKTDYSNASRTLLYNIHTLKWDEELCAIFSVPIEMLPEVCPSSSFFGYTGVIDQNVRIPITSICGDQQASLFGQNCFEKGEIKNTYGTGCFMLMNTKEEIVNSKNGLLSTIAWGIGDTVEYALEGSVLIGGASMQWLRDQLKLIRSAGESEEIAARVKNDEDIFVVPAFVGLGTPYWDNNARGAIFGLTRGTTSENIVKATLESIAYQSKDVIEVMKKEAKAKIKTLKVDGGATENRYLMQFQSDILNAVIKRPTIAETTALGAFYLAGLSVGFFRNLDEIRAIHRYQDYYYPQMNGAERKEKYRKWKRAIRATRMF